MATFNDGRYSLLSPSRRSQSLNTMDRLRRSFRDSFRRKKDRVPESSKPHQWQADEAAVRANDCSFPVKYLGCVEVFDSRGMNICEEALKVLRNSRRKPIKGVLFVTGDGLRVVDDGTKGLLVDQTIEKVSFCAPDRNHERGFSYICRDGTTRRWMCHGFQAVKDSGERLSHAVGCAFAVCLERKQKRDKEVAVSMNFDKKNSTFTRNGSFRQSTITERLKDPQIAKPSEPPPVKPVHNPHAIERPHATIQTLQRQGSFRAFSGLNSASPFKRQLSLRLNDLPSTLARQNSVQQAPSLLSGARSSVAPVPDHTPIVKEDTITEMCKELAFGLQLMSSSDSPYTPAVTPLETSIPEFVPKSLPAELNQIKWNIPRTTRQVPPPPVLNTSEAVKNGNVTNGVIPDSTRSIPRRIPPIGKVPNGNEWPSLERNNANTTTGISSLSANPNQIGAVRRLTKTTLEDKVPPRVVRDPFDAEWAALSLNPPNSQQINLEFPAASTGKVNNNSMNRSTNPFLSNSVSKAFEVQM